MSSDGAFTEQRATIRLKRYWATLRRSENGPYFADFRPERNPVPWEACCLLSWTESTAPALDHFGDGYRRVFGLSPDPVAHAARKSRFVALFGDPSQARLARAPVEIEGRDAQDRQLVLYRSILLSFVNLAGVRSYVLGAFTFSARPVEARQQCRPSLH